MCFALRQQGRRRAVWIVRVDSGSEIGRRHVVIIPMERIPPRPPGDLVVTADDELRFTGTEGGSISPSAIYLEVSKGAGFDWFITGTQPDWLDIHPRNGHRLPMARRRSC